MYVNEVLLTGSEKYHVGVMNGPLKFLTACKILPLLDLLAKFKRVLACSCSPNFCSCSNARFLVSIFILLEILWILPWIKVNVILYGA